VTGLGGPAGPRLAVTLGDPRGIGPEVAADALRAVEGSSDAATVIGPAECARFFERWCRFEAVDGGARGLASGRAAGLAVTRAAELAMAGEADAVVTGPVHKPAMAAAGFGPGHTEMLAELAGASRVGMLMCDEGVRADDDARADDARADDADQAAQPQPQPAPPPKRVLLATIHVPLARVPRLLTAELLVSQTRLLARALSADWGIARPRIALCALNPHASDDGIFGTEEHDVYGPALAALSASARNRWHATGPLPADTVFARAFSGEFDAVVAPYHDVGMAAFKTAAFGRGVNVTIGLPFVRTSPDHGTAFDIAGKGLADPSSMSAAIALALQLSARRRARA